ncbi:MAG: sulfatase [Acidobacteriia bacterium]|nr:sulfatase [Terriglobia bacterium]
MPQDHAQPDPNRSAGRPTGNEAQRTRPALDFATVGAALGLALGFLEAGLLRHLPRFTGLLQPDVRGAIWLIAPLADAPAGALTGLLLGGFAGLRKTHPLWRAVFAATGFGAAAAYVGWLLFWFRAGVGVVVPKPLVSVPLIVNFLITPAIYFVVGFTASLLLLRRLSKREEGFPSGRWRRMLALLDLIVVAALALALVAVAASEPQYFPSPLAGPPVATPHNNIVLIMLDTVRADHLSCYGYARPTTPRLDALALQGVLVEHAVAPTSWTLPALASVLTGLLPHQHGAGWNQAMAAQPLTLAEILKAQGYETAAFNANEEFGLAGWGLDQGFDVYVDAHDWLRHNLAATFVGQSLYQTLFQEFVSFNAFDHLDAEEINRQVFDWYAHRSRRPYFLFINYMDAHRPYVPPAPYDRRFGRIPKPILRHISAALHDGHWRRPISPSERQDLLDGYDNSLNYLDAQVYRLIEVLRASPDCERTFVIVAGDHGEGFGEHGAYDHGWDLYREVLHVPMLVSGPGIPTGERVESVAELREIFPTVLELALGKVGAPISQTSLSRFWTPSSAPAKDAVPVISELTPSQADRRGRTVLSLCDARWHFLLDSEGHTELFDWQKDAAESQNLAASPALQGVIDQMRGQMEAILARSVSPWWQVAYLSPLDQPGKPFARRALANPEAFRLLGPPVGSCQAYFQGRMSTPAAHPSPSQEDLLRSLPYH